MTDASHLRDSAVYGHLWATDEMRSWFAESARSRTWLQIYAQIAKSQAAIGAIPSAAADDISNQCNNAEIDWDEVSRQTREAGHSTAGLVGWLSSRVAPENSQYVAVATTVQDVSDTWTALTLAKTGRALEDDLLSIIALLRALAARHCETPMMARTHGQPAVPITLGFKLAQWGVELERHLDRLRAGLIRWEEAQLGGSVGSMAYWGPAAPSLLTEFSQRVHLLEPLLPWGSSRDCVAEFGTVAGLLSTSLAKIGNEVYQLQRPEIAELSEAATSRQIGSVTMPHKRNPERSEHLVTLSVLIRSHACVLMSVAMGEHERDGRMWKVEWIALPDLCCEITRATSLAYELLSGLEVHQDNMLSNIRRQHGNALSEQHIHALAADVGFPRAYEMVRAAALDVGHGETTDLVDLLPDSGVGVSAAISSAVLFTNRWLGREHR